MDINPLLLSLRWRPILDQAQGGVVTITIFKSRMAQAILKEQKSIYSLEDSGIEKIFLNYNIKNNRRVNGGPPRCVKKFKEYCKSILKL